MNVNGYPVVPETCPQAAKLGFDATKAILELIPLRNTGETREIVAVLKAERREFLTLSATVKAGSPAARFYDDAARQPKLLEKLRACILAQIKVCSMESFGACGVVAAFPGLLRELATEEGYK